VSLGLTQESLDESPKSHTTGLTCDSRANVPHSCCGARGGTASVMTLAEHSLAENDEEYGRADGRACIVLGKVSGPYRKA